MTTFTPVSAALGGLLIGGATALLFLLNGRVAGISGILGGALAVRRNDLAWRLAFIVGLFAAPAIYAVFGGTLPSLTVSSSPALLVVGGLLVGFGTRLGGGCTSGHGVCGIARLSWRSIAATAIFMTVAAVTVLISRHILEG
jgi:uncharacterized protein